MPRTVFQEFTKGLWAEVPPYRLVLGLCPTLAMTTGVDNGFGMGVAVTFVLVCSNILISLLRKVIPKNGRIACYIVVIATFVIVVELLMQAYTYPLFLQMGIFIPLIVVNCILLGRAEAFASKHSIWPSLADGLGMGIGFTVSLVILAAIREIFGNGTFWNVRVMPVSFEPFAFLVTAPGAFVCLGLMLCIMNILGRK